MGLWDIVLLAGVSLQVIILAYVHNPRWKAFMLLFPIPFTFSSLAVGQPIDATNVIGMGLGTALLLGWAGLFAVIIPLFLRTFKEIRRLSGAGP